ncbi:MAG: DnaB-like helicase C-terminal domain-containing protein, partial [Candidatus Nanopelagicaceae bacterium]
MSLAELPNYEDRRSGVPEFDRTPPQDLIAEQSVLGGMLLSKDAIGEVVEIIRQRDFYRPAHELIFDVIIDLYGRGEPADAVTVSAELTKRGEIAKAGGAPYLHTLISAVPTAANAGYYARIVRERAIARRLVEAGTKIVQLGFTAEGEIDDVVDLAEQEVYQVTERRAGEDFVQLNELIPAALDQIEKMQSGEIAEGIKTGFKDLDALTNGFHPGNMIVIAARPAVGKSTLGLDIARNAAIHNGECSVIFSLEMSRSEITMRMLSAEARVALNNIRSGSLSDDEWSKLARRMGEINDAPLFIDDSPNLSMMEIRAKARRLKQRHDLKLVVIDYLQLMTSGKKVENR